MKKMFKSALAFFLVISLNVPIFAFAENNVSTDESFTVAVTSLPTAEQLLEGYTNTTGIGQADSPEITLIEELTEPVPHLKIMVTIGELGGFNLHLPPKEIFEGRFYQLVHPTFIDRNVSDHNIAFAYDSGAYTLQTSGSWGVKLGIDVDAAAAHISRTIAKNYYEYDSKIYGYIYGGSGGSMQVVGAMEATNEKLQNIWDGAVPYITASPVSLGNFNIRNFARAVLEEKAPLIKDAVSPGGSGDPYAVLTEMESEVLREVTKLGLPLQAWENYEYLLMMNNHETLKVALAGEGGITTNSYRDKFWTEPGYLGTEDSELGELFRSLKESGVNPHGLSTIAYHRHIDPGANYPTWDHLKDTNGTPLYAQIGGAHSGVGTATMMSGGAQYTGKINMKVIMVQNLMDVDSYPTDGHWYRQRVIEQGLENNFRIWLNEYADHQENKYMHLDHPYPLEHLPERLINYVGSLEQALRDLSAWVEEGVEPPQSTSYEVEDSQLVVAGNAASRNGIQPVVDLNVGGAKRADIKAGRSVSLEATVQVPQGAGSIVSAEWDLYGDGTFVSAEFETMADGSVIVSGSAKYTETGTYFPQVRVTSQREGDTNTAFARVENLGRARVVVGADEEVLAVIELIKKIGKVDYSSAAKGRIEAAKVGYNALLPEQKALVDNYSVLAEAQKTYEKLEQEVLAVIELIKKIGKVDYSSAAKGRIEAAKAAYNALSAGQKALVVNYSVLTEAQKTYEKLEKDEKEKKADISKASLKKIASQVFTGKAIKPGIQLTYNGKALTKDKDYTVSYSKNVNIGTAKVVIKGKGNYEGILNASFAIGMKKGKTYTVGNYKYKVTDAKTNGKGTITVTGVKTKSLKSINVGDTVKIGGKTFKITMIGKAAFKDCKNATKATVGKNVKTIQANAFNDCKKLKAITIKSTVLSKVEKQVLKGIAKDAKIIVPKKQLKTYTKLLKNKGQKSTVKIQSK